MFSYLPCCDRTNYHKSELKTRANTPNIELSAFDNPVVRFWLMLFQKRTIPNTVFEGTQYVGPNNVGSVCTRLKAVVYQQKGGTGCK